MCFVSNPHIVNPLPFSLGSVLWFDPSADWWGLEGCSHLPLHCPAQCGRGSSKTTNQTDPFQTTTSTTNRESLYVIIFKGEGQYTLYMYMSHCVPYSGKLLREKHSQISRFWSHLWKFSPRNLDMPYTPIIGFSILQKFSLRNGHFLLYGM